jgi:hypothetical protein
MADNPLPIDPGILKNLYEFPDVCTTRTHVIIPQFPVTIALTNVGFETRNKESGSYDSRMGTTLVLYFDYITRGSLAQIISFWNRHQGKLMTFVLPQGHCIRTNIGIESSLWEFHNFWRFDMDTISFDVDADRNATNLEIRIKNVLR